MIPTANLDDRTFDDIREEAVRLIPRYCPEWTNHNASDPGITLIELFSWMTEMTLYRLNKVPQKAYLAMLELMGLSLTAPQSARTVVRFYPVENCGRTVSVKRGTKIASVSEDTQPVIFETEGTLLVRDTRLVSCINRTQESYTENINEDGEAGSFTLFEARNNIEHLLYIASPAFKYLKEGHSVQVSFESVREIVSVQDEITNHLYFECWDGRAWTEISSAPSVKGLRRRDNVVYLRGPAEIEPCTVEGREGFFVRAVLSDIPENRSTTVLGGIKVRSVFEGDGFIPDICIANAGGTYGAVDMNGSFRLFSEAPSFNEMFYIAADEIFKNKNSKVTLSFVFSEVYVAEAENENAVFSYEYWNGKDWAKIGTEGSDFVDGTFGFRQAGHVSFRIPKDMQPVMINNEEHLYVRIRLVTKDFSLGGVYVQDDKGVYQWQFNSKVQSPLLNKIRITYDAPKQNPEAVLANSGFKWNEFGEFPAGNPQKTEVSVFNIDKEHLPSLYLGFSSKISEGEFPIYFDMDDTGPAREERRGDLDFLPQSEPAARGQKRQVSVRWECWNGEKWERLDCTDLTDSFHESGFVNLVIPDNAASLLLYDRRCFWIRAVKMSGSFERQPTVRSIVINGVYAVNADTYENETAGSGNGAPGQVFQLAHANLLPGLRLAVNEGSIPGTNETRKMREDGIENPYTEEGKEVWVEYKEVPNFYSSDAFSRHFVIDYATGRILFGDGIHGMNPPKGKFNVKVRSYRVGGGENGNIAAHKLQFLTQSIPYISGCDNPFPAEGGADMETVESLKARSAGVFKSLNRAVTREDFEWISCEASSSVGRAHCLKDKTRDGRIKTVIVPEMTAGTPLGERLMPSRELLRRVRNYLDERKLVGTSILVAGPVYRDFRIKLELVFKNNVFDFDKEKLNIRKQLETFFHPLVGDAGRGFEFGKSVTKGLILKTLERNQAVLSVSGVEIFDEEAGVIVESLLSKDDELPYLSGVEILDKRRPSN